MATIVCTAGMTKGDEYNLPEGEIFMGRSESNDICVLDNMSSRVHCKIINDRESFRIVDMESTNGFLVNGDKVQESRELKINDIITINHSVYVLKEQVQQLNQTQTNLNTLLNSAKSTRVRPTIVKSGE
ncbi:MAG: FHA domain-containing protein [Lentisphaeraceae bacterium]|nr:FHA domain-containing protein [Lentisphaeraceae bacterium]